MAYTGSVRTGVWTIALDGTTSNGIKVGSESIVGAVIPADASVAGTKISFYGSMDGTTYYPIEYEGTAVEIAVSTAATINLLAVEKLSGPLYIQVVSDAPEDAGPIVITPIWRRFF